MTVSDKYLHYCLYPPLRFSLLSIAVTLVKCMMGSSTSRWCCLQGSLTVSALFWWVFCRRTSTDASGPSPTLWVCYVFQMFRWFPGREISQVLDKGCFLNDYSIIFNCSHQAYSLFGKLAPKLFSTCFESRSAQSRHCFLKQHNNCKHLLEFRFVLLSVCQFLIGGMENVNIFNVLYSIHV